jgi:5-methylcytosine-specific restriction endonuclease McrA
MKKQTTKREPIQEELKENIVGRDGVSCHYCGKKTTKAERQFDHLVPVVKGGKNKEENLVVSCKVCNRKKSSKDYDKFVEDELLRVKTHLDTLLGRKKTPGSTSGTTQG